MRNEIKCKQLKSIIEPLLTHFDSAKSVFVECGQVEICTYKYKGLIKIK